MLGSGGTAHAGYWQVSTTVTQSGSIRDYSATGTPPLRVTPINSTSTTSSQGYVTSTMGSGGAGGVVVGTDHTYQLDMVWTWNPNSTMTSGSHQKNKLPLRYYLITTANTEGGSNPVVETSCEGLPTTATRNSSEPGFLGENRTSGRVLVQIDNSALSNTITKTIVIKSKALVQTPSSGGSAYGRAYFELNVAVDERAVKLTRLGARGPIKQMGAPGVTINQNKDEWVEPDGTGHGQTRWSYTLREDASTAIITNYTDSPQTVSAVIGAQLSGNWSTNRTATWSNPNSQDQPTSHVATMPNGGALQNNAGLSDTNYPVPRGWYNVPSQSAAYPDKSGEVIYTLKDNSDNVTAKAKYILHFHDEWENPTANPDVSWTDEIGVVHASESRSSKNTFSLPVPPVTYSGINGEVVYKEWTFFDASVNASVTLNTQFAPAFKLKDWLNIGGSFETSASLEVSAQYASTATVGLIPGDTAFPTVNYFINTKHQLLDLYDSNGYVVNTARSDGKWNQAADLPLRPQDIRPDWIVQNNNGNNPTP